MPAYGQHFVVVERKPGTQQPYHAFFAVPHREVAVAHFVSFAVNPVAELVAALLYGALVYVGFAHVVEQRGYDYALGFDVS